MVSNIHDTTFFIKHIQDIFLFFFFCFYRFFFPLLPDNKPFILALASHRTSHAPCYVRLPLVPCAAEARPSLRLNTSPLSFLQTPSDGATSIVLGEAADTLPGMAGGVEWVCDRVEWTAFWSLHSAVTVRASPLHWVALNANAPTEVGSLIKRKKKSAKKEFLSSRRKGKIRALTVQAILKVIIWWFPPSPITATS